ncbi:hypothetical protein [Streptomyces virginiae]|uniref:hypothetical protein n=1 Tax=Streptomyces virginiae TaxID=1961 RepID=UPI003EBD800C
MGSDEGSGAGTTRRSLWTEEPTFRRRTPDTVRASAVRAVLVVAVTLTQATIAFFLTLTGSWLAFPMRLVAVAATVVATWAVLDVWITRQTWNQHYALVSEPSSTARLRRREAWWGRLLRPGGRRTYWASALGHRSERPGSGLGHSKSRRVSLRKPSDQA